MMNWIRFLLLPLDVFFQGILVLAATNRPHAIDAALMRPGRFDMVSCPCPTQQISFLFRETNPHTVFDKNLYTPGVLVLVVLLKSITSVVQQCYSKSFN